VKYLSFSTLISHEKLQAKIMLSYGDHLTVQPSNENDEISCIVVVNKERTNHRAAPYNSEVAEEGGIYPLLKQELHRMMKCDGTRAETRFRLSAKRTSPFKLAGPSVQSTTGS
jgi:hypothetical protein